MIYFNCNKQNYSAIESYVTRWSRNNYNGTQSQILGHSHKSSKTDQGTIGLDNLSTDTNQYLIEE